MKELGSIQVTLLQDRNRLKWRVNLVKGNIIRGYLKPIDK